MIDVVTHTSNPNHHPCGMDPVESSIIAELDQDLSSEYIWDNYTLEEHIIALVSYSAVFNDVISIGKLVEDTNKPEAEILTCIHKLHENKRVVIKDQWVGLPHLLSKFEEKKSQQEFIANTVSKKLNFLKLLGRLPLIEFVGISGSIAAGNPTTHSNKKIDVDIFLITSVNGLWLWAMIDAVYRMTGLKRMQSNPYCFNYLMDASDLTIHNQNFYIATEIRNLQLVSCNNPDIYIDFIRSNSWIDKFYPSLSETLIDNFRANDTIGH